MARVHCVQAKVMAVQPQIFPAFFVSNTPAPVRDVITRQPNQQENLFPIFEADNVVFNADQLLFDSLVKSWHNERGASSSTTFITSCASYLAIIGLGRERALPMIIKRLEEEGDQPDLWFPALAALTRANPVTKEMRGNHRAMARAWLDWAKKNDAW